MDPLKNMMELIKTTWCTNHLLYINAWKKVPTYAPEGWKHINLQFGKNKKNNQLKQLQVC